MLENNYFKMRKEFEEMLEGPEFFKDKFVLGILDFIFKHGNDDLKLEDEKYLYSIYTWDKSIMSISIVLPNIFKKDVSYEVVKDTILKLNKIVDKYSGFTMPRCIIVSTITYDKEPIIIEHDKFAGFNLFNSKGTTHIEYLKNRGLYEETNGEDTQGTHYRLTEDDPMFKEIEEPVEEETTEPTIRRGRLSLISERENDSIMTRVKAVNSLLATYDHRLSDPNIVDFEKQEIELKREFLNEFKNIIINNSFKYTNEFKFLVGYIDATNEYYEVEIGSDRLPNIFCSLTAEDILKYEIGKFIDNVCNLYFKPIKVFAYMKLRKYDNRVVSDLVYKDEAKDEWKEMLYCVYRDFEWIEHLSYKNGAMRG